MLAVDLKSILALEPSWTISINNHEFVALSSGDIAVCGRTMKFSGLTRVIESIAWLRPNVARVRARRRFQSKPDVLTFYPGYQHPVGLETRRRRRKVQKEIAGALTRYFGARAVELKMPSSSRRLAVGVAYPRFRVDGQHVIAVDPDEAAPVVDGIMRAAILWATKEAGRITVVVPDGRRANIVARLERMPRLAASFEWLQWDGQVIAPLDRSAGFEETRVDERRAPSPMVQAEADRILALRPDLLRAFPHASGGAVSIRLRGLEVARVSDHETTYPMGAALGPVIEDLDRKRRYRSRHLLARMLEERWLEASLIDHIDRALPSVNPRYVYPQVPSFVGQQRHIVDLLTVTRDGRLAVIEIKVGADPDLPLQALDYWLAVERHRRAGDFVSAGYFDGVEIQNKPALLIVAAPLLSFHRTFDRLVSFFPAEVPLIQLGIADAWKKEIQVLRRKGPVE